MSKLKFNNDLLMYDLRYKRTAEDISHRTAAAQMQISHRSYWDMETKGIFKIDKLLIALAWLNEPVTKYITHENI